MTFTEISTAVTDYCLLTSSAATTRVGKAINRHYRRITSQIGMDAARFVTRSQSMSIGVRTVTFTDIEKIDRILDTTDSTSIRLLDEISIHELRSSQPGDGEPSRWATQNTDADSVVALFDTLPQVAYSLQADGWTTLADLSGSDEPVIPESFHDILVWYVIAEELLKKEKDKLAATYTLKAEKLLSDLRFHLADSPTRNTRQASGNSPISSGVSGGGGGSVGGTAYTQSALITFDRDPSAPFAVTSGSAVVTNLDADKLDGLHATGVVGLVLTDEMVNALQAGVIGDGVADDAVAINAAIQTLYAAGGGLLYLPPATYLVGTQVLVKDKVTLCGVNAGATIIKRKSGFAAGDATVKAQGVRANLHNLTIDNNSIAGSGLTVFGGNYSHYSHLGITNVVSGVGLTIVTASANLFDDILMTNVDRGLLIDNAGASNDLVFRKIGITFTSLTTPGVTVQSAISVRFFDCAIDGEYTSLLVNAGANRIAFFGTYIEDSSANGSTWPVVDVGGTGTADNISFYTCQIGQNLNDDGNIVRVQGTAGNVVFDNCTTGREVNGNTAHILFSAATRGSHVVRSHAFRNPNAFNAVQSATTAATLELSDLFASGAGAGSLLLLATNSQIFRTAMAVTLSAGSTNVLLHGVTGTVTDTALAALTLGPAITGWETTAPSAPGTDGFKVFAQNSGGVTQLMALFATGVSQELAIQQTTAPYARGTWTPVMKFNGTTTGMTYSTQNGEYERHGNLVVASGRFVLSSLGTAAGVATLTGLPFAFKSGVASQHAGGLVVGYYTGMSGLVDGIYGIFGATDTISLYTGGAVTVALIGDGNFTATSEWRFTVTYLGIPT